MNKNQLPLCWSCNESNSFMIMPWALADLMVGKPYKEADTWEKTGARAANSNCCKRVTQMSETYLFLPVV
jgi:hypothetical protein